jgi:hypothetical protein
VLAALVGGAGLVPLFGDPRVTPLTHPLWARLLLRALEMDAAARVSARASQVFTALAWRDSLSFPADGYLSERDAVVRTQPGGRVVSATAVPAELTYALAVVQPGRYQLRAQLSGDGHATATATATATAEIVRLEGGPALEVFALPLPPASAWVFGGSARLAPGAYGARFLLPPGCTLERVEIAPPCLHPIEPPGGWKPDAPTTATDLAVTALRAMEREDELAPAATPLELDGDAFEVEAPFAIATAGGGAGLARMVLRAGRNGLRALALVDLPEPGLYSVSALIAPGAGQRWLVDGCRTAAVCAGGDLAEWRPVLSQSFAAGRHSIEVTLGEGASLQSVRFERKRDAPADYVAALARLGFDPGPEGPVTRAIAVDAARFVRDRRRAALAAECLERIPVEEATPAPATRVAGAPAPPPGRPPGTLEPPVVPPILPPQEVATPTQPGGGS